MSSYSIKYNSISEDDNRSETGQQQIQPVVSLLEKYASLHRGIDEARKEYAVSRHQIESIEGDIIRLVDVERIANDNSIENAVQEKEALLQKLENLTETALLEAQEAEALTKSNRELVRYKEEKAMRIAQDDQNQFLNESKVYREKIRTLSLRGELFGLKTPVALISAYKSLIDRDPSTNQQTSMKGDNDTDVDEEDRYNNHCDSLVMHVNHIHKDDYGNSGKNKNDGHDNDEEVQDLLEKLQTKTSSNNKVQNVFKQLEQKYQNLLQVKRKRENQKKNLQSQYDRLRRDARDMESKIENFYRQTSEATEMAARYRNGGWFRG